MGLVYEPPEPLCRVHLDLWVTHIHASMLILQPLSIMWRLDCHLRAGMGIEDRLHFLGA
jgi:hypothetical protein